MMINEQMVRRFHPAMAALRLYHRHDVVGMDHIPTEGPGLIVCNHSLATYDITLLMCAIFDEINRVPRSLIDRLFYKVPMLGELMEAMGSVKGTQENAQALLDQGHLVTVAPGGMYEALRDSSQRYQIRWERRKGFVKLAIEAGVPIILAACPKADDLYEIYPNPISDWAYHQFKIPVFLARGFGFTPLPRPVKLVHYLSEPIMPPKPASDPAALKRQVTVLHKKVLKRMEELMAEAVRHRYSET